VQLEVPMLYWMSKGFSTHNGLAPACVRSRALQPASHDNLFDTVLGLLDVETRAYKSDRDLFASCRAG
jgi:lipid A ethanolaminephosphotransferase